jgi:hypothetical protein
LSPAAAASNRSRGKTAAHCRTCSAAWPPSDSRVANASAASAQGASLRAIAKRVASSASLRRSASSAAKPAPCARLGDGPARKESVATRNHSPRSAGRGLRASMARKGRSAAGRSEAKNALHFHEDETPSDYGAVVDLVLTFPKRNASRGATRGLGAERCRGLAMGELVLFRPAGGLERKNCASRDQDARILFFTGVRYQRASGPGGPSGAGDSSAPPSGGVGGAGGGGSKRRG